MRRPKLRASLSARLAVVYGISIGLALGVSAWAMYEGTIGLLARSLDAKIVSIAHRLGAVEARAGVPALQQAVAIELSDRVDSDSELLGVFDAQHLPLAGNLSDWPGPWPVQDRLQDHELQRDGVQLHARLYAHPLSQGRLLIVGRDMRELSAVRAVIERSLLAALALALVAVTLGALLFRRQLDRGVGAVRRTAMAVEAGDLQARAPVVGEDEFALLSLDVNRMLDRLAQLVDGVRHVSNAIAHDLRTPLGRARNRLAAALAADAPPAALTQAARTALDDIDGLAQVFDKLLQIATAETGIRTLTPARLDLQIIAADMADLYGALAEQQQVRLELAPGAPVWTAADRDLVATALAALVDNAIKYAGAGASVTIGAGWHAGRAVLFVRDTGAGVPPAELARLGERFYRIDRSRHLPGNGLGMASAKAIAELHGGRLAVHNLQPGFSVMLLLGPEDAGPAPPA